VASSRTIRVFFIGFAVLVVISLAAVTAANNIPESGASDLALAFTVPAPTTAPGDVPPECASLGGLTVIVGTEGDDVISIGTSAIVYGRGGNDTISGNQQGDCLLGEGGNDVLYGGNGGDFLLGGDGDDQLYGERGSDVLYSGRGNDTLDGGQGPDTCYGGTGDTYISCETIVYVTDW
jgi:hypothetical protein